MCCSLLHFNRLLSFWIDIKFHIFRSTDNSRSGWTTCRLNKDSNCGFGVSDPTVLPFVLQQQTPPQRLLSLPKIFFFFFCGRYPHFRHPSMYWPVCSLIIYWYAVATERERERERVNTLTALWRSETGHSSAKLSLQKQTYLQIK